MQTGPQRSSNSMIWILGLGGVGLSLVCCCGGAAAWFFVAKQREDRVALASRRLAVHNAPLGCSQAGIEPAPA